MHTVTGALGVYAAQDRHSKQRKIADDVHDLVAHKLIAEPQALPVHNPTFRRKHYRVFKRSSAGKAQVAQRLHFIEKAKRSRRGNLTGELPVSQFDLAALSANH